MPVHPKPPPTGNDGDKTVEEVVKEKKVKKTKKTKK